MKRAQAIKLVLLTVILVAVQVATATAVFAPVELVFYDLWHRLAGQRFVPQHTALIVIDEPTLNDYRDDPLVFWTPHVAKASSVARAAGAKVVGLDFLFSISPESWIERGGNPNKGQRASYDQSFREEIGTGQLIQVSARVRLNNGLDDFLLPHVDYLMSIPDLDMQRHVALAGLNADKDSAVRSFSVTPPIALPEGTDATTVPRFALGPLLALLATNSNLNADRWHLGEHELSSSAEPAQISFAGPPGTIPRVSMRELLAPDALQRPEVQALSGKVVIIGGEYVGMGDVHPTPYASSFFGGVASFMTGPEIQANIVETLLSGNRLSPLSLSLTQFYVVTVSIAAIFLFSWLSPAWGLLALGISAGLSFGASYLAFLNWTLVSVSSIPLALAIAYLGSLTVKIGAEARERQRITAIFGRYVSDSVVDVLIDSENAPELGGVKQTITILFADIRSFTTISERLDAQEVVEFLNQYFERVCSVVLAEGGTIDKFIGDAIMVQFGAPVAFSDHALRATRAALEMRREATEFSHWMRTRFAGRDLPEFKIGIGLHTGSVVIGNIGSTRRSEYTAIGDAVNIASRIEGMTKEMGCDVLISRETLDAVEDQIVTGLTKSVYVKGRVAPVELFEVLHLKGEST